MSLRFALLGNPNSGKTTLFNALTGSTAHVGNWPGVTVDKKEGKYKKIPDVQIEIIDLPGIYSLSPYTPEEVISRNYILDEKPDCVINIIDATNLERNLYLTTQIMEIDVPMIIALNMMDVVEKAGDKIDAETLEKKLGIPVVEISALREEGVDELMRRGYEVAKQGRKAVTVLEDSALQHLVGDVKIALDGQGVGNPLFHAVKLIEMDELEVEAHPNTLKMVDEFKKTFKDDTFGTDFDALIADSRYKYITKNYSTVLTKKVADVRLEKTSDKVDKVLTSKWFGIPIFLVILFAMFHLTFAEDFLYLSGVLNPDWVSLEGTAFEGLFGSGEGIMSPGYILFNLMEAITSIISGWIISGLEAVSAPSWLIGFVGDGVLAGLCGVLSFIPQIVFLLLLLSILEDTGYMARVAFILDKLLRKFGVSGRAFIPMIMGFGCSVPAMINTRTLIDERERTLTIRAIPFFTCGAKIPILSAVAGAIAVMFGADAGLISFAMYVLGMVVAVVSIILMRSTTQRGEVAPFIMELPQYHAPRFKNLMIYLWDKAKHYLEKAFTIILASTIVIWFLSNFGWNWQMVDGIESSILASIGQFIQPIFTPLGFGAQLTSVGWVFAVAAITGLIAKEEVIATFGALAATITTTIVAGEGVGDVITMATATGITWQGLVSFIVFNMTTSPCFAAVATAKGEIVKGKFKWTLLFWIVASFITSSLTYVLLSWWWTAFIVVPVGVVLMIALYCWNKKQNNKLLNNK